MQLGRLLQKRVYQQDDVIYREGDPPVFFYIIYKGFVSITSKATELIPIYRIKSGYFGEYEIIFQKPRQYTAIAGSACTLYALELNDFKRLFLDETASNGLAWQVRQQAEQRFHKIEACEADFSFFIRRKVFWKLVLPPSSKRRKQRDAANKILKDAQEAPVVEHLSMSRSRALSSAAESRMSQDE